jgi:hypothetical protein
MSYWMAGAAVTTAVGGYLGSKEQAAGSAKAADTFSSMASEGATNAANYSDPFNSYRAGYASQLDDILQGRKSITTDPGYQFSLQQGQQGVARQYASKGMGNSGNAMAAMNTYSQGIASQQYSSIVDRLTNLAGAGSTNAIAAGSAYSNVYGKAMEGLGQAQQNQGDAKGSGIGSLFGGVSNVMGAFA